MMLSVRASIPVLVVAALVMAVPLQAQEDVGQDRVPTPGELWEEFQGGLDPFDFRVAIIDVGTAIGRAL